MLSNPVAILAFLTLSLIASHAALPPQDYWNSVLPNTKMPKAITDLLHTEKRTAVNVGKGGVTTYSRIRYRNAATENQLLDYTGKGKPGYSRIIYRNAATENQLHDYPNVALFFLEKDMHPGNKMNYHFTKSSITATFLPRQIANSIPFSSDKLPQIFNHFSVKPGSMDAENMKDTIEQCEAQGIKGEDKYCATSLESMIDYSISKLGKHMKAISTEVEKETQLQKYTIASEANNLGGDKTVVCHKQNYAYAVFYCHELENTRAYSVPLEGADGTKAKAIAVCHTDTSGWNPKHLAFQVLNVKRGTVPVCHFLPEDVIVWVPV